jgi:hypothetical protein
MKLYQSLQTLIIKMFGQSGKLIKKNNKIEIIIFFYQNGL